MRGGHVLNLPQFSFGIHLFDKQELATIDHRFRHHVLEPSILDELADLLAVLDIGRHRHRAHDMLASLEGFHAHPGMVRNGAVDMYEIDLGIAQHLFVLGVSFGDAKVIGHFVHFGFIASANGDHLSVGMLLVDRDELRSKTESHHCNVESILAHHDSCYTHEEEERGGGQGSRGRMRREPCAPKEPGLGSKTQFLHEANKTITCPAFSLDYQASLGSP